MKKYVIRIPEPCHENWDQMSPAGKGRHCAACDKMVVDFTNMRDEDILQYLLKHTTACGRLKNTQLNRTMVLPTAPVKRYWPAIAAMLVAGMFQLASPAFSQTAGVTESITLAPVQELQGNVAAKTEPAEKDVYQIDVKLWDGANKERIFYGEIKAGGIGNFTSDDDGTIHLRIKKEDLKKFEEISFRIISLNYEEKTYFVKKEDFRDRVTLDIYLTPSEFIPLSGVISIEPQK